MMLDAVTGLGGNVSELRAVGLGNLRGILDMASISAQRCNTKGKAMKGLGTSFTRTLRIVNNSLVLYLVGFIFRKLCSDRVPSEET